MNEKCEICGMELKFHGETCVAGGSLEPVGSECAECARLHKTPEQRQTNRRNPASPGVIGSES